MRRFSERIVNVGGKAVLVARQKDSEDGWVAWHAFKLTLGAAFNLFIWGLGGLMVGIWRVFQYVASAVSTHPQVFRGLIG